MIGYPMEPKKIILIIVFAAILICALGLVLVTLKNTSAQPKGTILYVGGVGSHNYTTITNALQDAADNYTIYIFSGTYNEHLTISRPLTLVGENPVNTIITGSMNNTVLTSTQNQCTEYI